jgi:hypothetical protein
MKLDRGLFWRCIAVVFLGLVMASAQAKPPFGDGWRDHDESSSSDDWRKMDKSKHERRHKHDRDYGWVKHDKSNVKLKNVLGMDDKVHSASCSGYPGTNAEFSFWSKKGKSDNVAVFFEGGGACWDATTCSFPLSNSLPAGIPPQLQFFVPAIDADSTPDDYDGMFDTDNPANPIRDWSIVYIPYCTGDLHTGSSTRTYTQPTPAPGVPYNPYIPASFPIRHGGFDNFMVVMDWMKKNIDKPRNVLVTGSSAGGYGAIANFPWIERAFRNAHTYVIADASQGVTTPAFDLVGRGAWNMQLAPWAFGNNPSAIAGTDLLRVAAKARPQVKTAQFTTAYDETQISFYGYMAAYYNQLGFYGGGGSCANLPVGGGVTVPGAAIDWNHQMLASLQSYGDDVPNFRYYLAEGSYHTLMRSTRFYTEDSAGVAFSQWVDDMLSNRGGRRGHGGGWENAASAVGLSQLPCLPVAP